MFSGTDLIIKAHIVDGVEVKLASSVPQPVPKCVWAQCLVETPSCVLSFSCIADGILRSFISSSNASVPLAAKTAPEHDATITVLNIWWSVPLYLVPTANLVFDHKTVF